LHAGTLILQPDRVLGEIPVGAPLGKTADAYGQGSSEYTSDKHAAATEMHRCHRIFRKPALIVPIVLAMVKTRPAFGLVPNLPDRGVETDLSWLRASLSAGEMQKLEAANTDRPDAQMQFGIQARNLRK